MQLETVAVPSVGDTEDGREPETAALPSAAKPGGAGWVLGAYAVLLIWGALYLFLFFADRLPN